MANPARLAGLMAAFAPSTKNKPLFSMSDRELQQNGFDRAGLERVYIMGLGAN